MIFRFLFSISWTIAQKFVYFGFQEKPTSWVQWTVRLINSKTYLGFLGGRETNFPNLVYKGCFFVLLGTLTISTFLSGVRRADGAPISNPSSFINFRSRPFRIRSSRMAFSLRCLAVGVKLLPIRSLGPLWRICLLHKRKLTLFSVLLKITVRGPLYFYRNCQSNVK